MEDLKQKCITNEVVKDQAERPRFFGELAKNQCYLMLTME